MLSKLKKQRSEGFTIIEVMIVLAIAALILLIVLLAVPALQRNSRNTQRKNDVSALLAGVSEFINNNNGLLPNGVWTNGGSTSVINIIGAASTTQNQAKVGYYNQGFGASNSHVDHVGAGTTTSANTLNSNTKDYVIIATGTDCDANNNGSISASSRSVTAVYEVETGNGTTSYHQQCQST